MGEQKLDTMKIVQVTLGELFIPHPRRTIAAVHSGHGVVFGKYQGNDVAAKPFIAKKERAARSKAEFELRMTNLVQGLGFFTLSPLEVVSNDECSAAVLLTAYEQGFVGGNALSIESSPDSPSGKRVARAIGGIATTLGRLHSVLITHGDPQAKNFGFETTESVDQEPLIFDLEKSAKHSADSKFVDSAMARDLKRLTYSLGSRNFGGSEGLAERHLMDTVIEPYVETRLASDNPPPCILPLVHSAIDNFHDTRKRHAIPGVPE